MTVELTDAQVDHWVALTQAVHDKRTWSRTQDSAEEAKTRQDNLQNWPKQQMATEEGRAGMMGAFAAVFVECDTENKGSLDGAGFWNFHEKWSAKQLAMENVEGHWIQDRASYDASVAWQLGVFGTGGRMTQA